MVTDWLIGPFRKARTRSHFLKCSIYYDSNKKNNNRQKDRRYKSTHKSSPSLTWWAEFTACPSLLPTAITAIDCCQFELMSPDHLPSLWLELPWLLMITYRCVKQHESSSLEGVVWTGTETAVSVFPVRLQGWDINIYSSQMVIMLIPRLFLHVCTVIR